MREFHIHGDNVIECERMIEYIEKGLNGAHVTYSFASPACPQVTMSFPRDDTNQSVKFLLYPGFNKTNGSRWKSDIYEPLKKNGSILDETPDALITRINNSGDEEVLVAIEFCSALQAGNQAWQRSGRAFSTSRSGCPYLYIVDFVKYELDKQTRQRKALRFPILLLSTAILIIQTIQAYFVPRYTSEPRSSSLPLILICLVFQMIILGTKHFLNIWLPSFWENLRIRLNASYSRRI